MRLKSHIALRLQLEAWATHWRKPSRVVQFPERGCVEKKGAIFCYQIVQSNLEYDVMQLGWQMIRHLIELFGPTLHIVSYF